MQHYLSKLTKIGFYFYFYVKDYQDRVYFQERRKYLTYTFQSNAFSFLSLQELIVKTALQLIVS